MVQFPTQKFHDFVQRNAGSKSFWRVLEWEIYESFNNIGESKFCVKLTYPYNCILHTAWSAWCPSIRKAKKDVCTRLLIIYGLRTATDAEELPDKICVDLSTVRPKKLDWRPRHDILSVVTATNHILQTIRNYAGSRPSYYVKNVKGSLKAFVNCKFHVCGPWAVKHIFECPLTENRTLTRSLALALVLWYANSSFSYLFDLPSLPNEFSYLLPQLTDSESGERTRTIRVSDVLIE